MKTLFHIESGQPSGEAQTLLIELGADHCSYAFFNKANNTIAALKYFLIDEFQMETQLKNIMAELRNKEFSDVLVCSSYPTALLTPSKYAGTGEDVMQLIYDQPMQYALSDTINEWQMVNVYSIPMTVFALIKNEFPQARFMHAYTPLLKTYNGLTAENQIAVQFTTQHFRILVKKESQVQLAQVYAYKTPLDVVYYLLKICSELQLGQSEVYLILSGLVEEDSALYKELHHYFLNIHFAPAPSVSFIQHEHPQHFFTSTYNLAACVL
ncbi:MAG: DUF3822 family protein [Flavisolibacter sp.]